MEITFHGIDSLTHNFFEPTPAKKFLPEWFQEIGMHVEDSTGYPTVKWCIPVTDMITAGYIIRNTYEIELFKTREGTTMNHPHTDVPMRLAWDCASGMEPGTPQHVGMHGFAQCPHQPTTEDTDYFKILNHWVIRTPPGYSCLIMQPHYFFEKRYTMMPAIVDTDKHDLPINFTGHLNVFDETVTIKPGDPLVQVIPFKRDEWKMNIEKGPQKNSLMSLFINKQRGVRHKALRLYKNLFHTKKKFD